MNKKCVSLLVAITVIGISCNYSSIPSPPTRNNSPTPTTFGISGTITGSNSDPLSGVTLRLSNVIASSAAPATTTSGSDGSYSFNGLMAGTYNVVSIMTGSAFIPRVKTVTVSTTNLTGENFMAGPGFNISGTVLGPTGAVISGVDVILEIPPSVSGHPQESFQQTFPASDGSYTFDSLPAATYTITPSKTGFVFTPADISVTISNADETGQNFTGASN